MLTFLSSNRSVKSHLLKIEHSQKDLLSNSSSLATVVPVAFLAPGIESAILVDVNRDVEHIGVIVERLLNSVT